MIQNARLELDIGVEQQMKSRVADVLERTVVPCSESEILSGKHILDARVGKKLAPQGRWRVVDDDQNGIGRGAEKSSDSGPVVRQRIIIQDERGSQFHAASQAIDQSDAALDRRTDFNGRLPLPLRVLVCSSAQKILDQGFYAV